MAPSEEGVERARFDFEVSDYANYPNFLIYTLSLFLSPLLDEPLYATPELSPADQRAKIGEFAGNPIYIRRVVDTAEDELSWEPSFEGPSAIKMTQVRSGEIFAQDSGVEQTYYVPRGQALNMRPMRIKHHAGIIPEKLAQMYQQQPLPHNLGPLGRLIIFVDHGDGKISQQYVPLSLAADREGDALGFTKQTAANDPFHVAVADYIPHFSRDKKGNVVFPSNDPLAPVFGIPTEL